MSSTDSLPPFGPRFFDVCRISQRLRAATYRAMDLTSDGLVFLKILNADLSDKQSAVDQFLNEAAIIRRIEQDIGPGIAVPVLGIIRVASRPCLVQPLLSGWTIAELLQKQSVLAPRDALALVSQTMRLVQQLHASGLVHGDLSTDNLFVLSTQSVPQQGFVPPPWSVRLLDFELSRRLDGPENRDQPKLVGKYQYLAPELIRTDECVLSIKSDIYALGILLYRLLFGEYPYIARSLNDVGERFHNATIPIPLICDVPLPVEELLRGMLAPVEQRLGNLADCLTGLAELQRLADWLARAEPVRGVTERLLQHSDRYTGLSPTWTHTAAPARSTTDEESAIEPASKVDDDVVAAESFIEEQTIAPHTAASQASNPQVPAPPKPVWEAGVLYHRQDAPPAAPPAAVPTIDNVQFTAYRPRVMAPEKWYPLLAFAHLSERAADAAPDESDPVVEVQRQALAILGATASNFAAVSQDSRQSLPRAGELTFLPNVEGVEFNPPRQSIRFTESVHRCEFRMRATTKLNGQTAKGTLAVFWGSVLVAEITLSLRVDGQAASLDASAEEPRESSVARPYRRIFASYSHADVAIVEQVEMLARTLGDEYLRDAVHLRAGEAWNDRLMQMIRDADVFQLFWSSHSMRSPYVRQEWEYALSLGREKFVRPTYWETPLPEDPEQNLPPDRLRSLHFQLLTQRPGHGELTTHGTRRDAPIEESDPETQCKSLSSAKPESAEPPMARPRTAPPLPIDFPPPTPVFNLAVPNFAPPRSELPARSEVRRATSDQEMQVVVPAPSAPVWRDYEVTHTLGQGGMGNVRRARHRLLHNDVVIKDISFENSADGRLAATLIDLRAALSLNHPRILRILDVREAKQSLIVIREFGIGTDLRSWALETPPPLTARIDVVRQLAEILAFAHARQLVHRDLSPNQVLIDASGRVSLMADHFVTLGTGGFLRTQEPGSIAGTVAYISPERIQGIDRHDPRSDVYALGAILYEFLCGQKPVRATGMMQLLRAILELIPEPVTAINPDVPEWLDQICARCLAKSPDERFQTMHQLQEAIAQADPQCARKPPRPR